MICIYKIVSPSDKVYIGQTFNYKRRMYSYKRLNCKTQLKLYRSFLKYGFINHEKSILCECKDGNDLYNKECYYIKLYDSINSGLNINYPNNTSNRVRYNKDNTISITYTLIYQLSFAPKYQWTKCNRCFNVQTGREIKQVLNSGSIGYCINGKFKSLKYLRTKLEKIPKKERLPF